MTAATDGWPLEAPQALWSCRLMRDGGFALVDDLATPACLAALQADAVYRAGTGMRSRYAGDAGWEGRGGQPGRALRSAPGDDLQLEWLGTAATTARLADLVGIALAPAGGGTYSYYEEPGDFLGLHRDIVTCDVALITCLERTTHERPQGGLVVYPDDTHAPLSAVRSGAAHAVAANLEPGQSIVLIGGLVPHEMTPMGAGERRVVSILCYRVQTRSAH